MSKEKCVVLIFIVAVVSEWSHGCYGANILASMTFAFKTSHIKTLSAIMSPLARRGHNITLLRSSNMGTTGFDQGAFSQAIIYRLNEYNPGFQECMEAVDSKNWTRMCFYGGKREKIDAHFKFVQIGHYACSDLFDDPFALESLRQSKFDAVIGNMFDGCDALVYGFLKGLNKNIKLIALTASNRYPLMNEYTFGTPAPSSYVPIGISGLTDDMTFLERVGSFLEHYVIFTIMSRDLSAPLNDLKVKHGIYPEKLDVRNILAEAVLWLSVTNLALDYPRPHAPNWISIGGIVNKPVKPLSQEYLDFIEGAGDYGFVIFCLGSYLSELPEEIANVFARVFSELPQRVIWRYTGSRPSNVGENTLIVDWLPQNDLLAHPKARLLIYHGGVNGLYEAIHHGVPMVIMPLFGDQMSTASMVVSKGMGGMINKKEVTYDNVKNTIVDVISNPIYAAKAHLSSNIFRDTYDHFNPAGTAVFWIEHVLKYGGTHMSTRAKDLNYFQRHSFDVMLFLLTIATVFLVLLSKCLRFFASFFCSRWAKKGKMD